jgi:HAMP domain-containing protein
MEGGVAILLLLLLLAVGVAFALAFTSLGGALGLRRRKDAKDAVDEGQPTHTHPTTPYHENTRFTRPEDERARTEAKSTHD